MGDADVDVDVDAGGDVSVGDVDGGVNGCCMYECAAAAAAATLDARVMGGVGNGR